MFGSVTRTSRALSKGIAASVITSILSMILNSGFAQVKEKTILFVCEHGSAKSIVAAAHFNRIAEKEGIQIKVISRGTKPDEVVPEKINNLLNGDGFKSHTEAPVQLTAQDLKNADYVVTFNPIPSTIGSSQNIETWNIPSFEAGYPAARDSMLVHIRKIIERIKTENQK